MKIKYTLPFSILLIPLVLTACLFGNETNLSKRVESPTGYYRELRTESRKLLVRSGDRMIEFYRFERNI